MSGKKREFVLMCLGLTLTVVVVAGFVFYLIRSPQTEASDQGLEALVREQQKMLIAQGKVEEAYELERKLKGASVAPNGGADVESPVKEPENRVSLSDDKRKEQSEELALEGGKAGETGVITVPPKRLSEKSIKVLSGGMPSEEAPSSQNLEGKSPERPIISESGSYDVKLNISDLESAALSGDHRASSILSICYRVGYGVIVDQEKAFAFARQASPFGGVLANFAIASCFRDAVGTEYDFQRAKEHAGLALDQVEVEAESGDPWVDYAAGRLFAGGFGVDGDTLRARKYYESAAKMGFAPAKHSLAYMLENGIGIDRDQEAASKLMLEAANEGWTPAKVEYALSLSQQADNEDQKTAAFNLIANTALSGSPLALNILGDFYLSGNGTERNVDLAIEKFKEAGELGDGSALSFLGGLYLHGWDDVEPDDTLAIQYSKQAAKLGCNRGNFYLGLQILYANTDKLYNEKLPVEEKIQICEEAKRYWSKLPSNYWQSDILDVFPTWKQKEEKVFAEEFTRLGVSVPWDEMNIGGVIGSAAAVADTVKSSPRGPILFGIQIGNNIEKAAEIFNRDHLETIGGEKLRVVKTPVGGDYICSNEEGLKHMLVRDKARADDDAALEQLLRDQMGPLGGLFGGGSAEQAGAPVIFGDENGVIIKYVFTPSYLERAFPNQFVNGNRQFLTFLNTKFDLPYLESEVVETEGLFTGEGFAVRYFGFTEDGVSIEIEADKTIIINLAD